MNRKTNRKISFTQKILNQQKLCQNAYYCEKTNLLLSYIDNVQHIGLILRRNTQDFDNNTHWMSIIRDRYRCPNAKVGNYQDGLTAFSVLLLDKQYQHFPFCIGWITTEIYTSRMYILVNRNRHERIIMKQRRRGKDIVVVGQCKYILKCRQCGVIFRDDEHARKCRWCAAGDGNIA
jgi:hypothetical protein